MPTHFQNATQIDEQLIPKGCRTNKRKRTPNNIKYIKNINITKTDGFLKNVIMDEKMGKLFRCMGIKYLSALGDMRHISFGKQPKKIYREKPFTGSFIQPVRLPNFRIGALGEKYDA